MKERGGERGRMRNSRKEERGPGGEREPNDGNIVKKRMNERFAKTKTGRYVHESNVIW